MTVSHGHDGAHDFDVLFGGAWDVANERLTSRPTGGDEWERFAATAEIAPILGGFGHVVRFRAIRDGKAVEGCTRCVFNPASGQWSLS